MLVTLDESPRAPEPTGAGRAPGLPLQLTSFIGREQEVAAVRRFLGTTRLLTLTGAGGSGKTRLALEACAQVAGAYAHGVAWVELAALDDPALLPGHVVAALALRADSAQRPEDVLVAALCEREMLLVLDNCEHLVDACADLAETLLRGCPTLRILATSREALGVGGERSWLVPVLSLPDPADRLTAAAAARAESVRLFVERAQDVLPSFALTDENAAVVAQICRRVDGLPLAIELAAARVKVLAPAQIAARLDDAFRLLSGGARTALPRHRALREVLDWSYDLLDDAERRLLARLSAFAGSFALEAAEAVCAGDGIAEGEVLDLLAALVDKSLVMMREAQGTARYHLLETVRQYAAERLAAEGRADAVRARHAAFFAERAREAAHFIAADRPAWMRRVQEELDNLRVALAWSREHAPALHLEMAGALGWFWYSAGLWAEGRRWADGALALDAARAPSAARAATLFATGMLATLQAQVALARPALEEGVAIAGAVGDRSLRAYALSYLGMALIQEGAAAGAAPTEEALALFREAGDLYGERLAEQLLATLYTRQGDAARARAAAERAVGVARAFGLPRELGIALQVLATSTLYAGDHARATALNAESLGALREDPQPLFIARALEQLGLAACARGEPLRGAHLIGTAEAVRDRIGAGLFRIDRERTDAQVAAARAGAGAAAFDAARAAGGATPLEEAIDRVLRDAAASEPPPPSPTAPPPAAPPAAPAAPATSAAPAAPPALRVLALGPLVVERDGVPLAAEAFPYARPRELLLYLLCAPAGRTREQIGLVFWPEASAAQVKNNFHVTLHHLRRALGGAEWVVFARDRYRVNEALGVEFDAAAFEAEVPPAARAVRAGGAGAGPAAERLRAALARYRGDFLDEAAAGDWHLEVRDRLRHLHGEALRALGDHLARAGAHAEAADVLQRLVLADPLDEEAARRLMAALAGAGRRTDALRAYERLAALLRADLDAEPARETRQLYERLRRGE